MPPPRSRIRIVTPSDIPLPFDKLVVEEVEEGTAAIVIRISPPRSPRWLFGECCMLARKLFFNISVNTYCICAATWRILHETSPSITTLGPAWPRVEREISRTREVVERRTARRGREERMPNSLGGFSSLGLDVEEERGWEEERWSAMCCSDSTLLPMVDRKWSSRN